MKKLVVGLLVGGGLLGLAWLIGPWLPFLRRPPEARLYADPLGGLVPLTVQFVNLSAKRQGEELQSEWIIDGAVVSTQGSFRHQFQSSGIHRVTLKVTNPRGQSRSSTATITVAPHLWWRYDAPSLEEKQSCILMNEPNDPDTWADNYLCSFEDVGLQWSYAGPIAGMRCTQINEPEEPEAQGWNDNYLCVPESAPLEFRWSAAGKIEKMSCLPIREPVDRNGWKNNYLCFSWTPTDGAQKQASAPPP
jgi:PKD repeat protein